MCEGKYAGDGRSGLNQILHESMLRKVGQAQCVWRERLQWQTGINPGCSRTKQLSQDSAGEARKDGIRG